MSLLPPYQRTAAGPQIPEPAIAYLRFEYYHRPARSLWFDRAGYGSVPYLFLLSLLFAFAFQISHFYVFHSAFFILYSAATIISAAGFLIFELYRHIPSAGFLIFGLCKLLSVADFLKILRLDLISIDDYLPLCVCMTGVV